MRPPSPPSPFRLRVPRGRNADWPAPPRPKGSRRPHTDAKVARVRRLIERTTLTYGEIAARTGVGRASICRWTRDGKWQRPLFAPRATDLIPRERAGAQLKMRTLAARLAALAERYLRELEATPGVDLDKLGEALALYQMAKLAARPRKRRRKPAKVSPFVPAQKREARLVSKAGTQGPQAHEPAALDSRLRGNERAEPAPLPPHAPPVLRLFADMRAAGIDPAYAPTAAVKDYVDSRRYEDLSQRPRNRTKRQRYEDWMREKI